MWKIHPVAFFKAFEWGVTRQAAEDSREFLRFRRVEIHTHVHRPWRVNRGRR